mmetsp:Transcript_13216/g.22339  ORF Transcript_13216/g.22339 Transcript_13216/m.22339 type:complete len:114 (-) Transcript_13216:295-636(-)
MPPSLAVIADPRLPTAVKPFRRRKLNDDEIPPDFMAILALVFGIIGTMSKNKIGAWCSVFVAASSLSNLRSGQVDVKQLVCSCSFAVMALVSSYMAKRLKSVAEKNADTTLFG